VFAAALAGRVSLRTARGSAIIIGGKGKKAAKSLALFSRAARRNGE